MGPYESYCCTDDVDLFSVFLSTSITVLSLVSVSAVDLFAVLSSVLVLSSIPVSAVDLFAYNFWF